jgi:hypothetical protein
VAVAADRGRVVSRPLVDVWVEATRPLSDRMMAELSADVREAESVACIVAYLRRSPSPDVRRAAAEIERGEWRR